MKTVLLLSLATLMPLAAHAELFGTGNSPSFFNKISGTPVITTFSMLPLKGEQIDNRYGWSETYWPSNIGGIAYRWSSPNPEPFKYKMKTLAELKTMNEDQLSQLSPAELYDIAMGDYNYTLTKQTLGNFTPHDLWWEGICHGWSQAATNYPEPAKVIIANPDGVRVPFGSSDVKGLLAMHEAFNYGGASAFAGQRCKIQGKVPGEGDDRDSNTNPPSEADANTPECRDVNAGTFHSVLTNMLGIHGRGFVADIDRYNDVWNQPIISYTSEVAGEEAVSDEDRALGVARKIRMKTVMNYGEELQIWTAEKAAKHPEWRHYVSKNPVTGTDLQQIRHKDYEYILELNAAGNIIGGTWVTETRVDFMWMYQRSGKFVNGRMPLAGLSKIYKPVRR